MKTVCAFVYVRGELVPQTPPLPKSFSMEAASPNLDFTIAWRSVFAVLTFIMENQPHKRAPSVFNN